MEELNRIKYQIETLQKQKEYNLSVLSRMEKDLKTYTEDSELIIKSREYYKKAIDIAYERSILELKDILNSALSYIFYDEDYNLEIELTDKRGKSLNLRLFHNGNLANLKRGTGMGVKTVISAILHMYYLQCKDSHVLMLDEAYSAVSEEYTDRFFDFLSQMCEKLKFKIILITHDPRYLDYGDKKYVITRGVVREK